jgi:hypothetical protein
MINETSSVIYNTNVQITIILPDPYSAYNSYFSKYYLYIPFGMVISNRALLPDSPISRDRYAGNVQNLPGKEKAKAGILPKSTFENFLLFIGRNSHTVILTDKNLIIIVFLYRELYGHDLPAVSYRIVHTIIKYL